MAQNTDSKPISKTYNLKIAQRELIEDESNVLLKILKGTDGCTTFTLFPTKLTPKRDIKKHHHIWKATITVVDIEKCLKHIKDEISSSSTFLVNFRCAN